LPYTKTLEDYDLIRSIVYPPGSPNSYSVPTDYVESPHATPHHETPQGTTSLPENPPQGVCQKESPNRTPSLTCSRSPEGLPSSQSVEGLRQGITHIVGAILGPACELLKPHTCSQLFESKLDLSPVQQKMLTDKVNQLGSEQACHFLKNLGQLSTEEAKAYAAQLLDCK
jgi:hypothetical protein